MVWVAVDKDGAENIFSSKPFKSRREWDYDFMSNWVELPKRTIKKLISKEFTWEDEPVELKDNKL